MEKIIFINSKGQSVELGNDGPYILTKIEGTGAVNVDIQTQKSPYQDGESYLGNTLEARSISIEVMILADNIDEMARHRHKILQAFNPKLGQGELIYQLGNIKREIKAISELAPVFPDAEGFKDTMQPGLIQLYCPNPFWKDIREYNKEIALWKGNFHFPLVIPQGKGIIMGYREPSLIVNVLNQGDVSTGMKIEFKAKGTLKNPSLFNINTRKFIKINKDMIAGEKIVIDTNRGSKKIISILNGVTTDILDYIDIAGGGKTFLQLDPGDNLFRYDADEGLNNLEVSIYYNNNYLGV